jgi:RNA polymerase subunit RPABC4/transcription elongation factor Spt4
MSPELINNIATLAGVLVAALGAFAFAFWIAIGIWTFNDIRSRTHDWLAIVLSVVLVMVFPIVGLILYWLIRPKTTLADVYDRALEEEALLRELEETSACATCGVPVKESWVFCPNCHSQLQHTCPTCSNLVRNEWAICVFCGTAQRPAQRPVELGMPQPSVIPAASQPALQPGAQPAQTALRRPARTPFGAPAPLPPAPAPTQGDVDDALYRPSPRPTEGSIG